MSSDQGLKQRRKPTADAASKSDAKPGASQTAARPRARKEEYSKLQILGAFLLFGATLVLNPMTIGHFGLMTSPCEGKCYVSPEERDPHCGPVDTKRLVYVRIPKTGSTTVEAIVRQLNQKKNYNRVDVGESEDAVHNIKTSWSVDATAGYNDDDPRRTAKRKGEFLYKVGNSVVYPPYQGRNRTFFYGHVFHLNWEHALELPRPGYEHRIPKFILEFLHIDRPTKEDMQDVIEFSIMRKPSERMRSMYYYVRTHARNDKWRANYIKEKGDLSFEDCLLSPECVELNELRRFGSLQTTFLCGYADECYTYGPAALEKALTNLREKILFVGTLERLRESLLVLEKLLPTYFEGVSELEEMPHRKNYDDTKRGLKLSPEAQAVLDEIVTNDATLYKEADRLLTERLESCAIAV
ncbi:Heparan sulfate 2-O-sulfotransferase 1 [Hondaea fermentalgiana]|uniref:Heparan sulfate 2-O-sulfotransferase 1 n=1 Tax=Hondaea fermentalgiana TaxID=2315210 RepID=A0A2R5H2U7_9STRA|nr:Heparan sulfate 2-O-sulfotransferase 1 [Hondaea fermentalgiana]|eukprot:GBG34724.1 Heparan sulfate 2-O-sulfotransferase 1 [Hondaea fermentalgiana]